MATFNGIIKADGNSLVRRPTTAFARILESPYQFSVLPYAQVNNLVGWFNNGDGVTTATGVSAWVDRVSGASLAQGTGALQPTYTQQVATLNGRNKAAFASTQFLSAGDVFDIRTNTGYTIQIYCKLSVSLGRFVFGKSVQANAPTTAGEYGFYVSGVNIIVGKFFDTAVKTTGSVTVDPNNFYLFTLVVNITNSLLSAYVNEALITTAAIANTVVDYNNGSAFQIGSSGSSVVLDTLEALVYQTALTQAEVAQNSIAMRGKYGQP